MDFPAKRPKEATQAQSSARSSPNLSPIPLRLPLLAFLTSPMARNDILDRLSGVLKRIIRALSPRLLPALTLPIQRLLITTTNLIIAILHQLHSLALPFLALPLLALHLIQTLVRALLDHDVQAGEVGVEELFELGQEGALGSVGPAVVVDY
jgi:hypothetical protein